MILLRLISMKNKISTYILHTLKYWRKCIKGILKCFLFIFTSEMFGDCLPLRSTWIHTRFSGIPVARSLVFCVVFCISLFVLFLWPLYCVSFLDLCLLITPLVSSNPSYHLETHFDILTCRLKRWGLLFLWHLCL